MVHRKYCTTVVSAINISLLLTFISAQAGDNDEREKLKNSGMNSSERPTQVVESGDNDTGGDRNGINNDNANVNFGPADLGSSYDMRATKIMDMNVVGQNDNELGTIEDLVLNNRNKVAYAIVSVGGVLGIGDKLVAIPFHNLRMNKAKEKVVLNMTEQQLKQAPEFKFKSAQDRQADERSYRPYSETGNEEESVNLNYDMNAKRIMDMKVIGQNNKDIGTVEDLILNNNDKIVYAIVSVGGMLGIGDKLVAVAFHNLRINKAGDRIMLNVTEKQLEQTSEFKFDKT